jgi:glucans biosynthesis protein
MANRATSSRRALLTVASFAALLLVPAPSGSAPKQKQPKPRTVDFELVSARAERLARTPYREPEKVPRWMLQMGYDAWRGIRFRPERALWRAGASPFTVQFFHTGLLYDRAVAINLVDQQGVQRMRFSPSLFDYGNNQFESRIPPEAGFAGFRVHAPIKTPPYHDEVIVFLGASYFRGVGKRQAFGLSARGIAIDTALSSGEEFPWFREFWLMRPALDDRELTFYALLDGPRVAGAYRFQLRPGEQTNVDVQARLFFRDRVQKLGLAPLTSMFLIGENALERIVDYRPEVHDSDGLLIRTESEEWIWRPLDVDRELQLSSFQVRNPRGFGLLQRDRSFEHYQDLEARPEQRPCGWVEPQGEWGEGVIELVEIPTRTDANDNVVAFFSPSRTPAPGTPFDFSYRLSWYGDDPSRPPGGRAISTRRDRLEARDAHRFVVDFEGEKLRALAADTVVRGAVTVDAKRDEGDVLLEQQVFKNEVTGGWRLVFLIRAPDRPVELRAFLAHEADTLTETWSYQLRP